MGRFGLECGKRFINSRVNIVSMKLQTLIFPSFQGSYNGVDPFLKTFVS